MNCYSSESDLPTDTILMRVMSSAEKYNDLVEHYSAEVYTRSYIETVKKNILYKYTSNSTVCTNDPIAMKH